MICEQALKLLEGLKCKAFSGTSDDLTFLSGQGLISLLSPADHHAREVRAEELPAKDQMLKNTELQRTDRKKVVARLERKLNSRWHRFWRSDQKIAAEESQLVRYRSEISANEPNIEALKAEVQELKIIKAELNQSCRTVGGFAALTEKGELVLRSLRVSVSRVGSRPFEEYEKALTFYEGAVHERYQRFKGMLDFLLAQGFDNDDPVVQMALSLSGLDGDREKIWSRAQTADKFLVEKGFDDDDRFRVISSVVVQQGDISNLLKELEEIYNLMINDGHDEDCGTLSQAAAIIKIASGSAKEKFHRFDQMGDALDKLGWDKDSPASCLVAANLAQREGDATQIAEEFRTLEKMLVDRGLDDGTYSGIAALILMGAKGTQDEKADRFATMLKAMAAEKCDDEEDYPAMAILSLVPGTAEENWQRAEVVIELLKEDGFSENLPTRAATIVAGCFRDFARQYLTSSAAESLQGLSTAGEQPGDPILAAAVVMMFGGNPMMAFGVTMATNNTLLGIAAGIALSPDVSQSDVSSFVGSLPEVPSFDIPDLSIPDMNGLESIMSVTDFDTSSLTDSVYSIDSLPGGEIGGPLGGD